jgi:hypothetical protein
MGVGELAAWVAERVREDLGRREVFGVTHSLGGIVARHGRDLLPWRGAVMLAPPNRGSRVAAAIRDNPLFRLALGPALGELPDPEGWPPPPSPFGVIAGTRSVSLLSPPGWLTRATALLPRGEPSDGVVAVAETQLPGMADFAALDASHTWIMNHPEVAPLVLHFIAHGRFRPQRP